MSGGGGSNQQSNTFTPPEWAAPYFKSYLENGANLASQPYQQYPGQQVAEVNPYEQTGWDLAMQRATMGAPDLNSARGMATDMTGGKYLNSNPWLNNDYTNQVISDNAGNMAGAFARGTAAQNDALAARSGAYGGSAWQNKQSADAAGLAQSIGQMANQYQLQRTGMGVSDYQQGLQQMLQAGNLAGNLSQDDWTAAKAVQDVGAQNRTYEQKLLDSAYGDYQNAQQWPYFQQGIMGNTLAQAVGSYGTNSQQMPGASPLSYLGAGAGIYGLLNSGGGGK